MAWYDESVFYHIYPLGLTGAPKLNAYEEPVHRLNLLLPWIDHIKSIHCNAIYIGPLFESVGHGYETTDYKRLDSRLGTNEDLKNFVKACHDAGIRVIFDGVFNHTGRDFFAFKDIQKNRENSPYKDWYCNVNFWGNNEYNDGFSYDNWGGYNLLVKLNQRNPAVIDYICDVVRYWVSEFDVDGIRLDAADVLDFGFMQRLRETAREVKADFWLMGEVIHGEYSRWVNEGTLHSVTNYHLHKALFSGHNDHNYFEIAHTVKRLYDMGGRNMSGFKLYNFVDNHDVERIFTKLNNKAHFLPAHIMLYTLPGIPSIYYGSEFGIEGRKERGSDDSLRPALSLDDFGNALSENPCTSLISALGEIRLKVPALSYGDYQEVRLTTRQYIYARRWNGQTVYVAVNNDDQDMAFTISADGHSSYKAALSGQVIASSGDSLSFNIKANSGEIFLSENAMAEGASFEPIAAFEKTAQPSQVEENTDHAQLEEVKESSQVEEIKECSQVETITEAFGKMDEIVKEDTKTAEKEISVDWSKPYEEMDVPELQAAVIAKLAKNGPVTDQMRRDVANNVYKNSLINWVKSFR